MSNDRPAQAAPTGPTGEALDAAEFDLRFGRSPAVEGVERHRRKDELQDIEDRGAVVHRICTKVDELGSLRATNMHAQNFAISFSQDLSKISFRKPGSPLTMPRTVFP